jgi:uncharacterized membrane protein
MNRFVWLLERHPLIFVHMVAAMAGLVLGAVVLARRKGTPSHRATGWVWVVLMAVATLTSAFIRDYRMINLAGFTPIHGLTVLTAVGLPQGIAAIRRGDVASHRRHMRNLYIGGCVVAGLFTLMPGRFLGRQLWALFA